MLPIERIPAFPEQFFGLPPLSPALLIDPFWRWLEQLLLCELHGLNDLLKFFLHLMRFKLWILGLLKDAGDGGLVQAGEEFLQSSELLGEELRVAA